MTREEQILELESTVKCRLAPSKIHGIGVFAIIDIKQGERLYCGIKNINIRWFDLTLSALRELPKEIYEIIVSRWPQVVNGERFLSPNLDQRLISFMNHSDDPNYDPITDTALKDIKAGEEITEDYRTMENWQIAFPWLK